MSAHTWEALKVAGKWYGDELMITKPFNRLPETWLQSLWFGKSSMTQLRKDSLHDKYEEEDSCRPAPSPVEC